MMTKLRTAFAAAATIGLTAAVASAHPNHPASGFADGLAHPISGLDHLLAIVGVGLWAAQIGRRATWAVPLAFVAAMAFGAAARFAGIDVPLVEPMVLTGTLALGLLIAVGIKLPTWSAAALVAGFAVFHGAAHAAELRDGASVVTYGAGFVLTTIALLVVGVGLGVGVAMAKDGRLARVAGGAICAAAVLMVAGVI
jgi:urease accessory protein